MMNKIIIHLFPILIPILIVVAVNEYSRPHLTGYHNAKYDVNGMNPNTPNPNKCTWTGYFDTGYCKKNHSKLFKPYFSVIDPIYFGMIRGLHNTGNYIAGNLILLVFLWPAIMYFLLIRIYHLRKKIANG